MPAYEWVCGACATSNSPGTETCLHCGGPAVMTSAQMEAIQLSTPEVGAKPYLANFAPRYTDGGALISALVIGLLSLGGLSTAVGTTDRVELAVLSLLGALGLMLSCFIFWLRATRVVAVSLTDDAIVVVRPFRPATSVPLAQITHLSDACIVWKRQRVIQFSFVEGVVGNTAEFTAFLSRVRERGQFAPTDDENLALGSSARRIAFEASIVMVGVGPVFRDWFAEWANAVFPSAIWTGYGRLLTLILAYALAVALYIAVRLAWRKMMR